MQQLRDNLHKSIPPGILLVSLTWIYVSTLAPGLSWANSGSDGGDLITAAATRGIAHPSGYPLYLLLARGFQLLPVGSLAFRTNLMSAFFAVLTSLLVYWIVLRTCTGMRPIHAYVASLSAGFTVGLAPLVWSQAVITEVYTLHAFFIALILYLTVQPVTILGIKQTGLNRLHGIVYGLALSNHLTTLALIPGAIFISCVSRFIPSRNLKALLKNVKIDWKSAGRQLAWMFVGLSVYVILPLRAMTHPVINWGNPVNFQNFWWLVSGKIYQAYYLPDHSMQIGTGIQNGASLLLHQFGVLGLLFGFTGLVVLFKFSRLHALTIWNSFIFGAIAIGYQSPDSYVYFIPVVISFSIWIGLSIGHITQYLTGKRAVWSWLFAITLLVNYLFWVGSNWDNVDASTDNRAEDFGIQMMTRLPEDAIVFVQGDQAVFASWYFHFALQQRPDISVIATDLLHWEWYLENLKTNYPGMSFSTSFPWPSTIEAENPTRSICQVKYVDRLDIICRRK